MQAIKWWEMTRAGRSGKGEIESQVTHYVVEAPPQANSKVEWEEQILEVESNLF